MTHTAPNEQQNSTHLPTFFFFQIFNLKGLKPTYRIQFKSLVKSSLNNIMFNISLIYFYIN